LGRRIPWAGDVVTATGKKLELGLRKKYVGPERGFPGSSGLGEQWGRSGENVQEDPCPSEGEGCPGVGPEVNRTGQGGSISEH